MSVRELLMVKHQGDPSPFGGGRNWVRFQAKYLSLPEGRSLPTLPSAIPRDKDVVGGNYVVSSENGNKSAGHRRVLRFWHARKKGGLAFDVRGRPLAGNSTMAFSADLREMT